MTFDPDLWPPDLNINRDHLITMDYLPTKFEGCGTKRSRVISCTRWSRLAWPLTLTFDLNINRDNLLIKDYPTPKFEASGAKRSWVINCTRWSRLAWLLTYWPESRTIYLPSLKLLRQSVLELSIAQGEVDWHDPWPSPLTYWPEYQ